MPIIDIGAPKPGMSGQGWVDPMAELKDIEAQERDDAIFGAATKLIASAAQGQEKRRAKLAYDESRIAEEGLRHIIGQVRQEGLSSADAEEQMENWAGPESNPAEADRLRKLYKAKLPGAILARNASSKSALKNQVRANQDRILKMQAKEIMSTSDATGEDLHDMTSALLTAKINTSGWSREDKDRAIALLPTVIEAQGIEARIDLLNNKLTSKAILWNSQIRESGSKLATMVIEGEMGRPSSIKEWDTLIREGLEDDGNLKSFREGSNDKAKYDELINAEATRSFNEDEAVRKGSLRGKAREVHSTQFSMGSYAVRRIQDATHPAAAAEAQSDFEALMESDYWNPVKSAFQNNLQLYDTIVTSRENLLKMADDAYREARGEWARLDLKGRVGLTIQHALSRELPSEFDDGGLGLMESYGTRSFIVDPTNLEKSTYTGAELYEKGLLTPSALSNLIVAQSNKHASHEHKKALEQQFSVLMASAGDTIRNMPDEFLNLPEPTAEGEDTKNGDLDEIIEEKGDPNGVLRDLLDVEKEDEEIQGKHSKALEIERGKTRRELLTDTLGVIGRTYTALTPAQRSRFRVHMGTEIKKLTEETIPNHLISGEIRLRPDETLDEHALRWVKQFNGMLTNAGLGELATLDTDTAKKMVTNTAYKVKTEMAKRGGLFPTVAGSKIMGLGKDETVVIQGAFLDRIVGDFNVAEFRKDMERTESGRILKRTHLFGEGSVFHELLSAEDRQILEVITRDHENRLSYIIGGIQDISLLVGATSNNFSGESNLRKVMLDTHAQLIHPTAAYRAWKGIEDRQKMGLEAVDESGAPQPIDIYSLGDIRTVSGKTFREEPDGLTTPKLLSGHAQTRDTLNQNSIQAILATKHLASLSPGSADMTNRLANTLTSIDAEVGRIVALRTADMPPGAVIAPEDLPMTKEEAAFMLYAKSFAEGLYPSFDAASPDVITGFTEIKRTSIFGQLLGISGDEFVFQSPNVKNTVRTLRARVAADLGYNKDKMADIWNKYTHKSTSDTEPQEKTSAMEEILVAITAKHFGEDFLTKGGLGLLRAGLDDAEILNISGKYLDTLESISSGTMVPGTMDKMVQDITDEVLGVPHPRGADKMSKEQREAHRNSFQLSASNFINTNIFRKKRGEHYNHKHEAHWYGDDDNDLRMNIEGVHIFNGSAFPYGTYKNPAGTENEHEVVKFNALEAWGKRAKLNAQGKKVWVDDEGNPLTPEILHYAAPATFLFIANEGGLR